MILGVLQARLGSERFPGKVLKPVLGKPMLSLQLQRLGRSRRMDALLVATSADPGDDAIASLCREMQVPCFRGSQDDVLDRVYRAAGVYGPRHVVRLTGHCPLADPAVVDEVIAEHLAGDHDYTSNCQLRTSSWPLQSAAKNPSSPSPQGWLPPGGAWAWRLTTQK